MQSEQVRLDRFLSKKICISRRNLRPLFARGCVVVDGVICRDGQQIINEFSHITCDGEVLQDNQPVYVSLK